VTAAKPTKTNRRKIAREVNRRMSLYLDAMTPNIETYFAEQNIDADEMRLLRLRQARHALDALIHLEQQT